MKARFGAWDVERARLVEAPALPWRKASEMADACEAATNRPFIVVDHPNESAIRL